MNVIFVLELNNMTYETLKLAHFPMLDAVSGPQVVISNPLLIAAVNL